ncbi:methyltransferase domain-containing protein [Candidatus Collierbacteria bacterium]|nr:methyltransferase domain-containing protein [Candidatus Collierbacteria bacterium]
MDIKEYYRLAKIEDSHWWYRSVHRLVIGEVIGQSTKAGPYFARPGLIRILDAGCGTGGLTEQLSGLGSTVGIDISGLALGLKPHLKARYVNGSINDLPFADKSFNLITCISVFYHRQVSDKKAAAEIFRVLKNGGKAIFIIPAFQWAFGSHDRAVHAARRYSMSSATALLKNAGFTIIKARYIFGMIFPEFVIKRFLDKIGVSNKMISDLAELPSWLNWIFELVCRFENWLAKWVKLPFGSSIYIVIEKP